MSLINSVAELMPHPVAGKDPLYFKRKTAHLKRTHFDSERKLSQENVNRLCVFYMVSLKIAKSEKPHTIAEEFLKYRKM